MIANNKVTEKDYHYAVQNPQKRKKFLRQLDLAEIATYVKKVQYSKDESSRRWMVTSAGRRTRRGVVGGKSIVTVYPKAFLAIPTLDIFLNALIGHEGGHAKQNYENPSQYLERASIVKQLLREIDRSFKGNFDLELGDSLEKRIQSSKFQSELYAYIVKEQNN